MNKRKKEETIITHIRFEKLYQSVKEQENKISLDDILQREKNQKEKNFEMKKGYNFKK